MRKVAGYISGVLDFFLGLGVNPSEPDISRRAYIQYFNFDLMGYLGFAVLTVPVVMLLPGDARTVLQIMAAIYVAVISLCFYLNSKGHHIVSSFIIHIGLLLNMGLSWSAILGTMPELFLAGVTLATIYLFTGNLLIAVGVHALVDAPMLIPKDASGLGDDFGYVYLMLALVAACLWRWRIPAVTNSAPSEAS